MARRFILLGLWIAGLTTLGTLGAAPARAQDTLRIAAVVNDQAISMLDVIDRANLIFATTGLQDTAQTRQRIIPQVLRTLIDETLELQEAKKQGYKLKNMDLTKAYRVVEKNLGLPEGQLLAFLKYHHLSKQTLDEQIKAEIVWSQLVQARMQNDQITEEDVDAELARMKATANQPAYLLAEIFLAVDEPSHADEVKANISRLRDAILGGASFPAMARQFSQGASAISGGDLGWISQSQLSDDFKNVVPKLAKGQLSQPIRVIGGWALILMRDKRTGAQPAPADIPVTLRQAIIPPLANETPAQLRARTAKIAGELKSCADFDTLKSQRSDVQVSSALNVTPRDLQPPFQQVVEKLPVGKISEPLQTNQGMHLLMVCQRQQTDSNLPTREQVRQKLENQQFDLISRSYLRDLRRAAYVDIRL